MEFDDTIALVTGAAGSIGKAVALRLVQQGAKVFITDLNQRKLDEISAEIGPNCRGLAADVTCPDDVKRIVEAAVQAFDGGACPRGGGTDGRRDDPGRQISQPHSPTGRPAASVRTDDQRRSAPCGPETLRRIPRIDLAGPGRYTELVI
ncbi:MAG: SDR family NAD(P)-dependent oxidoreductase [Rhodopirellula sp.]|nr:SDR family NAD(P)-dependent oxidoreductase [Rhodopirellula sp.]